VRDVGFVSRLTGVTAILLLISSVAGLLLGRSGFYRHDETLWSFIGQDVITLGVVLPLLLGSARLTKLGSTRGLLAWMGTLFYVAYSYYFYVVGGHFNVLFPVYIALVSIGMYGALILAFSIDLQRITSHFNRYTRIRLIGGFLIALALFFAVMWLTLIIVTVATQTEMDDVPRFVIAIDGVVLLPLSFFGGLWLWRREPLGYVLAGLLLVKVTATTLTLVVNTLLITKAGLPLDLFQLILYFLVMLFSAALLVSYFRCVDTKAV
jgi:hypothetical protein